LYQLELQLGVDLVDGETVYITVSGLILDKCNGMVVLQVQFKCHFLFEAFHYAPR